MTTTSDFPSADDFDRMEAELFERITVRHRRQARRHRVVATVAVLVVAGAGVAAGTIANPTQQSNFAYCYEGTSPSSHLAQVAFPSDHGYVAKPETPASAKRIASAVFLCEGLWRGGILGGGSGTGSSPVPKLQVCLRDDLIVSVFRKPIGGETPAAFCDSLGLTAP